MAAIDGPGTEVYANLLTSLVIGVTFAWHVARAGALAELSRVELVGYLVPAIRGLLAPAVAAAQAAVTVEDEDPVGYAQDMQRERCTLFVACTRARDHLYVSGAGEPSPFLSAT